MTYALLCPAPIMLITPLSFRSPLPDCRYGPSGTGKTSLAKVGGCARGRQWTNSVDTLPSSYQPHSRRHTYNPPHTHLSPPPHTHTGQVIAKAGQFRFLHLSAAAISDKWIGEGPKRVRAAFSLAHRVAPCIIFVGGCRVDAGWVLGGPASGWVGGWVCVRLLVGWRLGGWITGRTRGGTGGAGLCFNGRAGPAPAADGRIPWANHIFPWQHTHTCASHFPSSSHMHCVRACPAPPADEVDTLLSRRTDANQPGGHEAYDQVKVRARAVACDTGGEA